ncbi:hypothetical protein AQS8620_03084 [Aquimixticola soesokkakensis]|uniref:UPF0311 protein AQS8620_03084 n=1 Tax=Aquimixticola soesokkakensis TaxID=1519096 RepID=A0A1Y5TKM6_9RHOB|nr:DUF3237 domain-containing protein [Aquimixticola soesokkakensis]SLN66268.1 hypothetical protein AQS8620_03084 [Aquimixticola soesokkakensis]
MTRPPTDQTTDQTTAPTTPALEFAFAIRAEIAPPRSGGKSPLGERLHIPITGGTVTGPRLRARILPGGSDWPLITPDGTSKICADYTIEAEDGTLILVHNEGLRASSAEVLARLRAGEKVRPEEFYFRCAPRFDVGDGPHAWLRSTLFVGSIAPQGNVIEIDVFAVT